MNLTADGLRTFCGRLHVGTAEKIFRTCRYNRCRRCLCWDSSLW